MYKDKTFLAIIPARGGSKRLPHKNIEILAGKPMITWTIEASNKSKYIDHVVVSSDDHEILEISQSSGTNTLKRPKHLAEDNSTTIDVLKHTIKEVGSKFDYVLLLQPTSPLRNNMHIDQAIEWLFYKSADAVISVCEVEHSPQWSSTLDENLSMANFLSKDIINKRSQDLQAYYRLNGAIYIYRTDLLLKQNSLFLEENVFAFKMGRESSVDIDNQIDFHLAGLLLQHQKES